jgi:hypothetical protein
MIAGETIASGASPHCDCGTLMVNAVQRSAAGYFIGTFCGQCGPYSRESGYYSTAEEAQADLDSGDFGR